MDSYLNIASLALAIAALVQVMVPVSRARFWTVTAAVLALVVLLIAYQVFQEQEERVAVASAKQDIWSLILKAGTGMSFEQVYDNTYYRDFRVVNKALDSLVEDQSLSQEKIETRDATGTIYTLRKFSKRSHE